MRRGSAVGMAALMLGLLLMPLAGAQQSGDERPETVTIDDESGDVRLVTDAGEQEPPQQGQFAHVDIIDAWIGQETDATVSFGYTMAAATGNPDWFARAIVHVYFTRQDVDYRITSLTRGCAQDGQWSGALEVWDSGREFYRTITCLDNDRTQVEGASVSFMVEKEFLTNRDQVPLRYGDELRNFHVEAMGTVVPGAGWLNWAPVQPQGAYAYDRAPDNGHGPVFRAVLGVTGRGHIFIDSPEPIRVSNGEATTIVYQVGLHNDDVEEDQVLLTVKNPESTWDVRVPARLTVPPGAWIEFPVILSMQFTHRHGETVLFEIRAESTNDPDAWSTVQLGVHWTEIPQPAGHHNILWLHSATFNDPENPFETVFITAYDFKQTWMNPLRPGDEPDPNVDESPVPAYFNTALFPGQSSAPTGPYTAFWDFPLSPGLLIGLDFDLTRSNSEDSKFVTVVQNQAPSQNAHLEADLLYCRPTGEPPAGGQGGGGGFYGCQGEWVVIVSGKSDPSALSANGQKEYLVPMQVHPSADLLPYQKGANLRLQVRLVSETPQNVNLPAPRPLLHVDKSELYVPLIEYHDPIDQAFEAVGSLALKPLDPFEKNVNPGRTTYFNFQLTNMAEEPTEMTLDAEGVNNGWARILQGDGMKVKAKETRNVTLEVVVPPGAAEGERAELFVVVQSVDDPNVVAVSRVRATVVATGTEDISDEAGKYSADAGGSSPALALIPLLMALSASAALATRRRRG